MSSRSDRFRLLALDVDGTLLDGRGELRSRTKAAVARAAEQGIRPVLCTGRRYRRARPIAVALGLDAPLVCNSGALVKDPEGDQTLWRADFSAELLSRVLQLFCEQNELAIGFTDAGPNERDFVVSVESSGRPLFDDYLIKNRGHARVDPEWMTRGDGVQFHLCAIGERPAMLDLQKLVIDQFGDNVRTFVQRSPAYEGTMCEVLRGDANKWSAVLHLAELWGIHPSQICAIGDDMNDLPMIEGAGFGIAMDHAPDSVKAVADHVTHGNDDDGVAIAIETFLLA